MAEGVKGGVERETCPFTGYPSHSITIDVDSESQRVVSPVPLMALPTFRN